MTKYIIQHLFSDIITLAFIYSQKTQAFSHCSENILGLLRVELKDEPCFKCRTTAPQRTECENTFKFHWALYKSKTSMIMMGSFKLEITSEIKVLAGAYTEV